MEVNSKNTLSSNYIINTNEDLNCNNNKSKEKFNLINIPDKKDLSTIKAKLSMKSPNKNGLYNSNKESKKTVEIFNKTNFNKVNGLKNESSLNVKNYLDTNIFQPENKINKTQTNYHSNKNLNIHKKSKFEKTKNNFLRLITKSNNENYIREYTNKNSKYSLICDNNHFKVYDDDSLEKVQKQLQNKIIDMGKEAELMEFEIGPLDISINRFNVKDNKKKIINKKTKNSIRNIINQITSPNSKNENSENIFMNKSSQYPDINHILNIQEKKDIKPNYNLNDNLELNTINNKKRKDKNEKESNNSPINKKKINHFYKHLKKIFKTKEHKSDFIRKDINLLKNKTYSNIDSKFGTSIIDIMESSENNIVKIDEEKFRLISRKKMLYDSLDDEELIEDAIIENFYLEPNSILVIIVDTLVLLWTFWNIIYKPLYLVLNNCDVKNTITALSLNNISNIFIDLLYICDLIINCFKAYYNFDEQLITKNSRIFIHYIKKYFFADLICAIPYYSIIKFIALKRFL